MVNQPLYLVSARGETCQRRWAGGPQREDTLREDTIWFYRST